MCYGERIKAFLDDNGIKYSIISKKSGLPLNILSPILNGKRKIVVDEYFRICDAIGKPYDFGKTA